MIDWPLITCLVKRWRLKTHMFHVPIREMTITLQDVAIILGLHIHGPAVIGTCVFDVMELCGELLDVTPPTDALKGSAISIRWLCDQLSTPTLDAYEVTLKWSERGLHFSADEILLVCGHEGSACPSMLSPTARYLTKTAVYSWASVVRAQLYQELYIASLDRRRGISSCITLLQVSITLYYYVHIHIHNTLLIYLLFCLFCIQLL